jgi:cytochrome c biogenesis protein CcdA
MLEFLIGFLAVNLVGGLLIMLGPGQFLTHHVPKLRPPAKHIIELVAGVVLITIAIGLWTGRRTLGRRKPPSFRGSKRTGLALGVSIAAVEFPTALPYFAAIAVIVGTEATIPIQVAMLVIFNLAFLAPVLAILLMLVVSGDNAEKSVAALNAWLLRHWPGVLAAMAALIGLSISALGLIGLLA